MPLRTPRQPVSVLRDGKRVLPEVGRPFDFTNDEIEKFDRLSPNWVDRKAVIASAAGERIDGDDAGFTVAQGDQVVSDDGMTVSKNEGPVKKGTAAAAAKPVAAKKPAGKKTISDDDDI